MTRKPDPTKAQRATDNLRAAGLMRRRAKYDFDFVTPVGLLTSVSYEDGERKALVFRRPAGESFMAAILALLPTPDPQAQPITPDLFGVAGAPICFTDRAWRVVFDLQRPPSPSRTLTVIDSECQPMPNAFELPHYSRVRCAGRLTQREGRYVTLELHAIQVIDPAPSYGSLFRPIMGGYVHHADKVERLAEALSAKKLLGPDELRAILE